MIKNKLALVGSAIILCICMYLYFPFPNLETLNAITQFMSFPIRTQDGYAPLGIIGSFLFIIAIFLLIIGIKKHRFLMVVIVLIVYALLPKLLIGVYQETLASGISAISYDGKGTCDFKDVSEDVLDGECSLILRNHSNEDVSFKLEFLDSFVIDDGMRMESLMNLGSPYNITIKANSNKSIHVKKLLELSDVPKHINGGTSNGFHIKINDGEITRIL